MIYLQANAKLWKLTLGGLPTTVAHIGDLYEFRVLAYYGLPPYVFSLHAGTLPGGLALNSTTGLISGTLTTIETKAGITIRVTDAHTKTADLVFDVDVQDIDTSLSLTGVPETTASIGVEYSFLPVIHHGSEDCTFTLNSAPFGIVINETTGEVSGSPTTAGLYPAVYITVDDNITFESADSAEWDIQVFSQPLLNGYFLTEAFSEEFTHALSLYNVISNPTGRWKTNFPFGNDGEGGLSDAPNSRTLPGEKQIYTDLIYLPTGNNPFSQAGGSLFIEAKTNLDTGMKTHDPYQRINGIINPNYNTPLAYTSGLISSQKSFSQLYGYFEAAMALPSNIGCSPMFWLYNQYGDEIVAAEYFASTPTRIYLSQRKTAPPSSEETFVTISEANEVHLYGVMWTAAEIIWFINREEVWRRPNNNLNRPMYLIVNHAVGGAHGNLSENTGGFPTSLEVQAIRAFTLSTSPAP